MTMCSWSSSARAPASSTPDWLRIKGIGIITRDFSGLARLQPRPGWQLRLPAQLVLHRFSDSQAVEQPSHEDTACTFTDVGDSFHCQQRVPKGISGTDGWLGAPARTPTPTPNRAMSARDPATILPCLIRSSICDGFATATSNASPASI